MFEFEVHCPKIKVRVRKKIHEKFQITEQFMIHVA